MDKIINEFNTTLLELFKIFKSKNMRDKIKINAMELKLKKTLNIKVDYHINILGPYLWNNREDIKNQNSSRFLNRNYNTELIKLSDKYKFNYKDSVDVINSLKDIYKTSSENEQDDINQYIFNLLKYYANYIKHSY